MLLPMSSESASSILSSKVKLGGDASAAAGPVGRTAGRNRRGHEGGDTDLFTGPKQENAIGRTIMTSLHVTSGNPSLGSPLGTAPRVDYFETETQARLYLKEFLSNRGEKPAAAFAVSEPFEIPAYRDPAD